MAHSLGADASSSPTSHQRWDWNLFAVQPSNDATTSTGQNCDPHVAQAIAQLRPITQTPAHTPLPEAFNWNEIARALQPFAVDWFVVAFRSIRKATACVDTLHVADALAHAEARTSGGLLAYYYGGIEAERRCLAMCVWQGASYARAASLRPLHKRAASLAAEMYDAYHLETYSIRKNVGATRLHIVPTGGIP